MKKQAGAALVIVLVMLTVSLMLGLSSMQASLIEERLAGNYKTLVEAQMGAERAASAGWGKFISNEDINYSSTSRSDIVSMDWAGFMADDNFDGVAKSSDACGNGVTCHYRYIEDGSARYVVAMGVAAGDNGAESEPVFMSF